VTLPSRLWEQQALQWARLGAPLRPAPEDRLLAQRALDRWCRNHSSSPRALVLGATPELASLDWPAGSEVVAVDLVEGMLRGVWMMAPSSARRRLSVVGNWLQMPLQASSVDVAMADGSFSLVRRNVSIRFMESVREILRSDGVFALRSYVRPPIDDTPNEVWDRMLAGPVGGFSTFKLRLLMALHDGTGEVRLADAWRFFHDRCTSYESLAARTGWSIDEVSTVEAYRDQNAVYRFPTLTELRSALAPYFDEEDCAAPPYDMGDRCLSLLLRPRP
jgi:SAM-dependent methyltransferase